MALEQFGVAWEHSLQAHIPGDRLARVSSYDALGSFAAIPLGEALIGPLAAAVTTPGALIISGSTILVATATALTQRSVRTLET